MEQLLAHLAGDYLLQTPWMAEQKLKRWIPAILHGLTYTLPFILITTDIRALAVIGSTHVLIDKYRLAKRFLWFKSYIGPRDYRIKWSEFEGNGVGGEPAYIHFWLMILADNTIHLLINYIAISNWG